jgi:excisionase family DNA binding protein
MVFLKETMLSTNNAASTSAAYGLEPFQFKLLYSREEAAQTLGISLRTTDRLIAEKELPIRRIRGRVFVTCEELVRFIKRDHPAKRHLVVGGEA